MLHDIAPSRFDNFYRREIPNENSYILFFEGQNVLSSHRENILGFPRFSQWNNPSSSLTYLFSIDNNSFFLADGVHEIPSGYQMHDISIFRGAVPKSHMFAGFTAMQLHKWYTNHRFCGKCGSRMEHDGKERMLMCPNCHSMIYPNIAPAVIVGITRGDEILMTRYANRPYKGFALIAGFTEIGETIEETVKREVLEEVGLQVKNIRFYKSQPWPHSDSLLIGFFAELDGEANITLDEEELSEAFWVKREEIELERDHVSLTNDMILAFKADKMT